MKLGGNLNMLLAYSRRASESPQGLKGLIESGLEFAKERNLRPLLYCRKAEWGEG